MALTEKVIRKGFILNKEYKYEKDALTGPKALKQYKKDNMKVSLNNIELDANIDSINYMSTVLALVNSNVLDLLATGMTAEDAFATAYKQTVPWKTTNGTIELVDIHFIKAAVGKAMAETASVIGIKESTIAK
jgi:hypothetical protein